MFFTCSPTGFQCVSGRSAASRKPWHRIGTARCVNNSLARGCACASICSSTSTLRWNESSLCSMLFVVAGSEEVSLMSAGQSI